jgi:hypothetical protein|tara:strand:+ start:674 stop:928 length:255 start_codon:yes stop_codon:yes gene_type:complete
MDPDEIRKKGNKIVGFEHRSRSGKTTELLGIYNMPDPNSPMNRLIRYMGKVLGPENNYRNMPKKYSPKKVGTTQGRNNPRKGAR